MDVLPACTYFRSRLAEYVAYLDAAKCAIGAAVSLVLIYNSFPFVLLIPFLPLALFSPARHKFSAAELLPRLFITDMAVTQFLQPYPVAGSQLKIAAVPVLLWAFICMADGMEGLSTLWRRNALPFVKNLRILNQWWPGPILAGAVLIAAVTKIYDSGIIPLRHLEPPSKLSGSRSLRLPPEQERDYEFIAGSIAANCDVLFTMPGMGSFNFWSGVPTPNGWNLNVWMKAFSLERQNQILVLLQSTPGACVVYNPSLLSFWHTSQDEAKSLPLARYIMYDMPKVAERGAYEIRVHPNRTLPWLGTGL